MADEQAPLTAHLEELRKRLMISAGAWLVGFLVCYGFSEKLFQFISEPVRSALPPGSSLVFISATEPFFVYLKIAAIAGLIVALPVILWEAWLFVAPALYKHEKKFAIPFIFASCCCFGAGTYFGFFFVFPTIFTFLVKFGTSTGEISAMLSMEAYLSLSCKLLFAFGLVFELPIVIFFLARMGIVDYPMLARNRKYFLVLAFIIGAILTPPDVVSQIALAIPMILLYEVGALAVRLFGKKRERTQEEQDAVDAAG